MTITFEAYVDRQAELLPERQAEGMLLYQTLYRFKGHWMIARGLHAARVNEHVLTISFLPGRHNLAGRPHRAKGYFDVGILKRGPTGPEYVDSLRSDNQGSDEVWRFIGKLCAIGISPKAYIQAIEAAKDYGPEMSWVFAFYRPEILIERAKEFLRPPPLDYGHAGFVVPYGQDANGDARYVPFRSINYPFQIADLKRLCEQIEDLEHFRQLVAQADEPHPITIAYAASICAGIGWTNDTRDGWAEVASAARELFNRAAKMTAYLSEDPTRTIDDAKYYFYDQTRADGKMRIRATVLALEHLYGDNNPPIVIGEEVLDLRAMRTIATSLGYFDFLASKLRIDPGYTMPRSEPSDHIRWTFRTRREHYTACSQVLLYFRTVLERMHPDVRVGVDIRMEDDRIVLVVTGPAGSREILEDGLSKYVRFATGHLPASALMLPRKDQHELERKLHAVYLEGAATGLKIFGEAVVADTNALPSASYGQKWSWETPRQPSPLSAKQFLSEKEAGAARYELFICDEGEFASPHGKGTVHFALGTMNLEPIPYKVLVAMLKHGAKNVPIPVIAAAAWGRQYSKFEEQWERYRQKEIMKSSIDGYKVITNRIRELGRALSKTGYDCFPASNDTYSLQPVPRYCLIEASASRNSVNFDV